MVLVRKAGLLQCSKIYYYIKEMHTALCQLEKKQSQCPFIFCISGLILCIFYITVSASVVISNVAVFK